MKGRVLIVAGSDSGGGAGIEADIKTVTALGAYASTAITAVTAQNTETVRSILSVPAHFVQLQIEAVLGDIGADCIKTGMLLSRAVIEALVAALASFTPRVPLVVDPVLVASSGASLLEKGAIEALRGRLLPRATVLTPNLPEAEALTQTTIVTLDDMRAAGEKLLAMGPQTVVIKGGHMQGDRLTDLVMGAWGSFTIETQRMATRSTHGTGCTYASAIATGLAQGLELRPAVERAHRFVQQAIRTAPGFGRGHGPLNHAHTIPEG